jgi:beta-1,4-mannosyltransferase
MSPSRRRRRASPEWEGRKVITVAALPGRGLYVRHLGHPEGVDGVHRPTVVLPGATPRMPALFEPRWLAANLDRIDVVHVHGVSPRQTPDEIAQSVDLLRESGRPLVVTLYHLTDPSGLDPAAFGAQLDALVSHADRVITLTQSAAAEVDARWPVSATVLPHPHVVDFVRMRRERGSRARRPFIVGAHLGSLRFPADPLATTEALTAAVRKLPGARLDLRVHHHLLDPDSSRYEPAVLREMERLAAEAGGVLRADRPMNDPHLWDYLYGLDVSFVPPLAGSHSIWPEACFDLGTASVLPADSHAAGQQESGTYRRRRDGTPDPASLAAALRAAYDRGPAPRADPAQRWKERVAIAERLRSCYEELTTATATRV